MLSFLCLQDRHLGTCPKSSNLNRSLQKCILSAIMIAGACLCAYAMSEPQPFGAVKSAQVATLLVQLAGLLPHIGISMLAFECLHMGIAARLNRKGLALNILDSTANGLSATSLLFKPSALRDKGSSVRITAIVLSIATVLIRFTLDAYPLLPGGVDGSQANATFTLIGEQSRGCGEYGDCSDLPGYMTIANSITAVSNATFTQNFTQQGDALIIPPWYHKIGNAGARLMEIEQDTLKLSSCQHTNLVKPVARTGDLELSSQFYGRTVLGLAGGIFRFGMDLHQLEPYHTMECQAQLTRYKYIQDVLNGGPIQIIHELNTSALPVYNLTADPPNANLNFSGEYLQVEYSIDATAGTRDFIALMVDMMAGSRLADLPVIATMGRQAGPFRLDALAIILFTATSITVWIFGVGLLIWYTYCAGNIATGADRGLLTAARHGPELNQLLRGGCNGNISTSSAQTVVQVQCVHSHLEITNKRRE